ncbi:MAG: cytochrome c oxidase subunit 3 family protein [Planctomycetaceae bacterium]|nr:cytochrome c oxidase subunit 3 family protein [Planctomycetaceae bacterium]
MIAEAQLSQGPAPHADETFRAHHFETAEQQFAAAKLGMWLFLVTEVLFFSGLFVAYAVFRVLHPEVFVNSAALLDTKLGAINTVILLFSSLTMAWAVRCSQLGQQRGLVLCLSLTIAAAVAFLGVKGIEYAHKWHEGHLWASQYGGPQAGETFDRAGSFFSVYFAMTGLHAVHIIAGIAAIGWLLKRSLRGDFSPAYYTPVDVVGLYWHLVDLVWIFLFPLLYLVG